MAHVVWDWNGTLMDDFGVLLAAANSTLTAHGGQAVDVHRYRIDGRPADAAAGSKTPHLARHIAALNLASSDPSTLVMIGDTMDDSDAATENGIPVVLYAGGEFDAQRLASTGAPVAATLRQAAEMAGVLHH